jgi:hypothetical protein
LYYGLSGASPRRQGIAFGHSALRCGLGVVIEEQERGGRYRNPDFALADHELPPSDSVISS